VEKTYLLPHTRSAIQQELAKLQTLLSSFPDPIKFPIHNNYEAVSSRITNLRIVLAKTENRSIPEQFELVQIGHLVTVTTNPGQAFEETFSFTIVSRADAQYLDSINTDQEFYDSSRPLVQAVLNKYVGDVVEFAGGSAQIINLGPSSLLTEP